MLFCIVCAVSSLSSTLRPYFQPTPGGSGNSSMTASTPFLTSSSDAFSERMPSMTTDVSRSTRSIVRAVWSMRKFATAPSVLRVPSGR